MAVSALAAGAALPAVTALETTSPTPSPVLIDLSAIEDKERPAAGASCPAEPPAAPALPEPETLSLSVNVVSGAVPFRVSLPVFI